MALRGASGIKKCKLEDANLLDINKRLHVSEEKVGVLLFATLSEKLDWIVRTGKISAYL